MEAEGSVDGSSDAPFGPLAVLGLGFSAAEFEALRRLLHDELGAGMVKVRAWVFLCGWVGGWVGMGGVGGWGAAADDLGAGMAKVHAALNALAALRARAHPPTHQTHPPLGFPAAAAWGCAHAARHAGGSA